MFVHILQERISEDTPQSSSRTESVQLVQTPKKENIIEKTLQKLRETTTVSISPLKTKTIWRVSVSLGHFLFLCQLC